jgi:lysophospholipase L1-like esterase
VNYAHLLAARMNLMLTDASCAGATSANVLHAWNELPAQIDSVTPDTALVTITVGGNDLAFAGNLTAASCEPGETIHVAGMTLPCPAPFPVSESAYDVLHRNLVEIARQIQTRAPHARIIFIQYVTLVPERQCAQSRFTETEATELRQVARRLSEITDHAGAETGATVLHMDLLSRGHTPCDHDPWSTGLPRDYNEAVGAPWHPNRRGMQVIADELEQVLRR